MLVKVKLRSISTTAGFLHNGDIVDLPEAEVKKISILRPDAFEVMPEPAKPAKKKAEFVSKRASVEGSDD